MDGYRFWSNKYTTWVIQCQPPPPPRFLTGLLRHSRMVLDSCVPQTHLSPLFLPPLWYTLYMLMSRRLNVIRAAAAAAAAFEYEIVWNWKGKRRSASTWCFFLATERGGVPDAYAPDENEFPRWSSPFNEDHIPGGDRFFIRRNFPTSV